MPTVANARQRLRRSSKILDPEVCQSQQIQARHVLA